MIKTLNNEANKARFISLYYGQQLLQIPGCLYTIDCFNLSSVIRYHRLKEAFLSLRSISSLADEQKTELAKRNGWVASVKHPESLIEIANEELETFIKTGHGLCVGAADYLRSIGILIQWMYLSVEDINAYGWAKEDVI